MFDRVHFRSFKCLADVTLELGQLTLLVGANASGKSTVLDGIDTLCRLATPSTLDGDVRGRAAAIFAGPADPVRVRTLGASETVRIAAYSGGGEVLGVEAMTPSEAGRASFNVSFVDTQRHAQQASFPLPRLSPDFWALIDATGYGAAARLRLDASHIAGFAPDSTEPTVGFDGTGTAAVIAWLAEQRSPALDAIEADLRRIVPRARKLLPERTKDGTTLGRTFKVEMDGGARIAADLLSEGTLLTVGLLTVLHRPPVPRLILLDDFDRALHPKAQRELVSCVKDMLAHDSGLQFVCTTHSPYVLDLFDAKDVRVLRADEHGHTHAKKLTEHPEWERWKDTMKAGEFWSFVGEDWLVGSEHAA